jgi:hypothetical protein
VTEPAQEQVDINLVLKIYRTKLAEETEKNIILEARLMARDEEIARLRAGSN